MEIIIVSGLSGAGKSVALGALEDSGIYCVDNAPIQIMSDLISQMSKNMSVCALSVDARNFTDSSDLFRKLKQHGHIVKGVFLDARDDELIRRYSETRRRHPGCIGNIDLREAIDKERVSLSPLSREFPQIDTSGLKPADLRSNVIKILSISPPPMLVKIESFGFKNGLPSIADFQFDVRCLPNPHWVPELRQYDGRNSLIDAYFQSNQSAMDFLTSIQTLLKLSLPLFASEGRPQVSINIGCTGGKHRSVWIACKINELISSMGYTTLLQHRHIERH